MSTQIKTRQISDFTPSVNSLIAASNFNYKNVVPSSVVTGTVSETQLIQIPINPNSFGVTDLMKIFPLFIKSGTIGSATVRIRLTTASTMPTTLTSIIATYSITASSFYTRMSRTNKIYGGNIETFPSLTSALTDIASLGTTKQLTSFDPTVQNYLYVSVILTSTLDSVFLDNIQITNN